MTWLRHTDVNIHNFDQLTCLGHNDEEYIAAKDWEMHSEICSYWHDIIWAIVLTATSIVLTFTIAQLIFYAKKHRYKIRTWYYKLRLANTRSLVSEQRQSFKYDVYICYLHNDDTAMDEIRNFLEDENDLKCCIPQRDCSVCTVDNISAVEQSLENSASTVVLWSRAALASKWHKAEYKMARYIELYRNFDFKVIHILAEDLSDVKDDGIKLIFSSGKFISWHKGTTNTQVQTLCDRLLEKIYRR